ncbi:hypothetical protein K440DRAFT_131419 [Wilcoxina mikolae CBS 423.85]|nr:hypothetical protein K440DRAFT_131419 [Wilcoxina mikolae CBS 423.85]
MPSPVVSIVIEWLCLLVTYGICGARIFVLWTRKRKSMYRKCDTEIILCLVLLVGTCNVSINTWKNVRLIRVGDGTTSGPRREEQLFQLKLLYAQSFIYFIMVWLIKAAFLSTYFHFREKITKTCKTALYILTFLVAASFIIITLVMILTCLPIERAWSLNPNYFCSPQQKIWNHSKTAAANIFTDLFLVILFLAILRRLHLGRRERWGVIFFLTVSAIPIIAAILRLTIIILALKPLKPRTPAAVQRFYDVLYLASEIEVTTAFIAACLPAMRVFVREKRETRQYSRTSNEYKNGNKAPPGTPRTPRPQTPRQAFLSSNSRDSSTDGSQGFKWGNVYPQDDIELEIHGSRTGLWPSEGR